MVNISDVARAANVSKATVSNVFSRKRPIGPEVTERVLAVAKDLGYYPNHVAVSLSTRKTMVIGLKMPLSSDGEMPLFNTSMISGVVKECSKSGYRLLIDTLPEQNDPTKFTADPVDGVILLNPRADDVRVERYSQMNIPLVVIGKPDEEKYKPYYVDNDNTHMMDQLGKYLIDLGHRNILFLNSTREMTVSQDRAKGLIQAFQDRGLCFEPRYELHNAITKYRTASEYGYRSVLETYGDMKYTAIIADTDYVAIGAMRAARELGLKLPEELSIVALNNNSTLAQEINPALTCVELYPEKLGRQAASLLLELMNKAPSQTNIIINSKLIIRDSSTRIPFTSF